MGEINLPVTQGHKHGMRVLRVHRHIVVNIQLRQDRYRSIPVQGGGGLQTTCLNTALLFIGVSHSYTRVHETLGPI